MDKLDLDPAVTPDDYTCESAGVPVVVSKRQVEMIRGSRIDYVDENGERGFKVYNPNFQGESASKWLAVLNGEKSED